MQEQVDIIILKLEVASVVKKGIFPPHAMKKYRGEGV